MTTASGMIIDPLMDQQPITAGQLQVELEAIRTHAHVLIDSLQVEFNKTSAKLDQHEQVLHAHVEAFKHVAAWHPAAEKEVAAINEWKSLCQAEIIGINGWTDQTER